MKFCDYPCPKAEQADLPEREQILKELKELEIEFPAVFNDADMYERYVLYQFGNDKYITLPLDHALEAEAYGAEIVPGNAFSELRLREPKSGTLDDVKDLPAPDFTKGRFSTVFACLESLSSKGRTVGISTAGPYTFYAALIPLKKLLIGARKEPAVIEELLKQMVDIHFAIIEESLKHGASFVSLADPTGSYIVLGPQGFQASLENYAYPLMMKLLLETSVKIVLCPKYMLGLKGLGVLKPQVIHFESPKTYSEGILEAFERSNARIFGDRCPNESRLSKSLRCFSLEEI